MKGTCSPTSLFVGMRTNLSAEKAAMTRPGLGSPWRELCLALLLLSRCGWVQAPGTCHQLSVADGFAGELTSSGGTFDPASETTVEECATVCGQLGVAYSAVETMDLELGTLACLCAPEEEFQTVTTSSTECTACQDSTCGGVDGIVYVTPSAEDLAELTMTVAPEGSVETGAPVSITATTDVTDVEFTIQVGDQSPSISINGTNIDAGGALLTQDVAYFTAGTFTLVLTAQKRGGSTMLARQVTVNVTESPVLMEARCPPVQEPNVTYYCGAVVAGNGAEMTAAFSDDGETTFQVPSMPVTLRGSAPPQGPVSADTELVTPAETFLVQPPFATAARLVSVRVFGLTTGTCTGELVTPTCTAPDVFCPAAGVCSSSCALLTETTAEFQCTASIFCPLTGLCAAGTVGSGECGALGAPASFTAAGAQIPISVSAGEHAVQEITTEVIAQPGDMLQVTCEGGAHVAAVRASGGGDLDSSGAPLQTSTGAVSHLLQVTAVPMHQFSWEHACATPVEMVTFTASLPSGVSVTNATSCEYIIRNMSITLMQEERQLSSDEPDGPIYLDTSLPVTVMLQMLEGAPALMSWDYGTANLTNGTQDLLARVDPAEFYNQVVTYPAAGMFTINASATNTHSEVLGATWATQEVILQNPVLEAWTVEITNTQILTEPTNTVEAEVEFLLKLPDTERLPTDAFIYAHFGDRFHMEEFQPLREYGRRKRP